MLGCRPFERRVPDVIVVSSSFIVTDILKVTLTRFSLTSNLLEFFIYDNVVEVESMRPTVVRRVDELLGVRVKFLEVFKVDNLVDLEVGGSSS